MKAKKALVCKSAFQKLLIGLAKPLVISLGIAYIKVTKEAISWVLMT